MVLGNILYQLVLGIPVSLTVKILEQIRDEADRERLVTEEAVKGRLRDLQILVDTGAISEDEYDEMEQQLIERLRAIRETEKGM